MREHTKVAYTGPSREGLGLGDEGVVLVSDSGASHVQWSTGARAGSVVPVYDHDLVATNGQAVTAQLEDSLEVGSLMTFSARRAFDEGGEVGLINAMVEQGHLASFAEVAEEAVAHVASRIRQDPSVRVVLGQLDDEEGESFLRLASACLIRDAFDKE